MSTRARVIKFDEARGFGFVETDGGRSAFVHVNDVAGRWYLNVGELVDCRIEDTDRGPRAFDVHLLEDPC